MDLRIYEHDPNELEEVLAFRNGIFGHVDRARWEAMDCTAVVARQEGRLVGFIPLQFRTQVLRPGVTVPVVYENAVGVAESERGKGIGSQMIDEAAAFMADRVDALLVIRGGERSTGYRFYRKTGHGDLSYMRNYGLMPEVEWPPQDESEFVELDRDTWLAVEPETLALYAAHYGTFGGGRLRTPGYWRHILDGHVYGARSWHFVTSRSPEGELAGYLVATHGTWDASDDLCVYEIVGENAEVTRRLLTFARRFSTNGAYRVPYVSLANPICETMEGMGFEASESTSYVMGRMLRPDRIFARLAGDSGLAETLALGVSTPHRTVMVSDPPSPRYEVHVQTKESYLTRLLCCRLDLAAAVAMELVRWNVRDGGLARALNEVFTPAPWVTWMTDYV